METASLSGKTAFITGATSGLGKITACELASAGANVTATARSTAKGQSLLDFYKEKYPQGKGSITILPCDLSSLTEVRNACLQFAGTCEKLDILINNAGLWNFHFKESKDKIEEIFAVNFLASVLITQLLLDKVTASPEGKIIFTASGLHQGEINFDDPEFRKEFTGFKAYRQSKLALILFTRLMADKLKDTRTGVYSQHPGMVKTGLGQDAGWLSRQIFNLMGTSPENGSKTLTFLAKTPNSALTSGEYYYKCKVKEATRESNDMSAAQKLLSLAHRYLMPWLKENEWNLN